ncbi:hypothetical protein AGOR_G00137250 [Albula goreensis]|uniref:Death-inducer obliterator 1 n=1 Tax=Albula goreensis TaxID=1534307 RepID=A0A8T3D9C6_9TELE|nr:hypothetical protein AGOR_G00137250 [Albula goreensis]
MFVRCRHSSREHLLAFLRLFSPPTFDELRGDPENRDLGGQHRRKWNRGNCILMPMRCEGQEENTASAGNLETMLSDTDPLLPSYSEPYQLALQCVPGQDSSQNTGFLFQSCELSHMEENVSTELEAEKSQNHVEICYKASAADDKDRHTNDDIVMKLEEPVKAVRPTSKEFTKTWRFRSTTIAQRAVGDVNRQDRGSARSRRGGRRCSGKAAEELSAPKFVQGGKRNTTACLESSETPSQSPSDSESASEASFDSIPGLSAMEESADNKQPLERTQPTSVPAGDATSSDQGDSDELTLKELQDLLRKRRSKTLARPDQDADPLPKEAEEKGLSLPAAIKSFERYSSGTPPEGTNQDSMSSYKTPRSSVGGKKVLDSEGEEKAMDEEEPPDKSESKGHDSNALYCICQQKHNNRFMICCDHCEEWFHGDCVGITEVRGQLLERNGEDYVCPNCTMQTQPRTIGHSEETEQAACMTEGSLSTSQPGPSPGVEGNDEDGQGIRGRIEKAVNPRRTKKMKIFRPVEESGALAKCIGPGCNKNALPDSVYCGTDCILKHAAATMKSLTSMKEPPPKTQAESKPATKSVPKGQKTRRRVMESCSRVGEEESSSEEGVVEPDSSSSFWSSDHCNDTAKPEKSTAIPSSVFYKSSGKESEGREGSEGHAHPQKQSPPAVKVNMKNPNLRHPSTMNKPLPISRDVVTKKLNLPSRKSFISKKSIPVAAVTSQAACPPASKSVSGALRVSKINYTVPRMLSPQQQLSLALSSAACFASPSQPPRPQPNNQIRHDIRRSLTEILIKRVSDSDDLEMTEKEVGRLAVSIEKEMYNLFLNTDKYKKKYRTIMFSLKDTKNKGLFFRIIRGEVTPFNLVRFSPEELLSQDVSGWMHKETTEAAVSSKPLPGQLRLGLKQEASPMEKGESPLMSEGDACLSAASPLSCMASVPEQENRDPTSPLCKPSQHNVASPATDFFSMMLNDTTAEHRTHLFNLNCKICTGRVSTDDEPVSKKPKNALTTEQESHRSKAEDCTGDSPPPDSDFSIMESPASPDDTSNMATISEPIPIPAVPSVTITVRDPRIAGYRPVVSVPPVIPTVSSSAESVPATKPTLPPPPPPPPPKSILLKPTSSPAMRFLSASGSSSSMADSRAPPGGETTLFLSKQEVVWKGFLNMHSVAKFVTKSYLVSGSLDNLKEDLPDTIHIGGRISPNTVWDYIDKLKTFLSKELCLIRFQPATDEEEVAYISLFSYFNSRGRFGVVANNSRNIKDLYLIPLGAKAPIPTQFLPFEGPGLEPNRPDLLLGLVICQKPKRDANKHNPPWIPTIKYFLRLLKLPLSPIIATPAASCKILFISYH